VTLHNPSTAAARAYDDAARRLMGETITLRTPRAEKPGLISRLFGRKAAA
jgi:septum site-determining protein MinD